MTCKCIEYNHHNIKRKFKLKVSYEIFIAALALAAVVISALDITNIYFKIIDNIILYIFAVDYVVRIACSKDKRKFFSENILELIAILPFSSVFRIFRITRLFKLMRCTKVIKLLRIFTFSKKFHMNIKKFLSTNGFKYMIYITIFVVIVAAALLYIVEKDNVISTFEDAVWLSFCSTSLFGYEGIENLTLAGKAITGVLVILGIVFTGMFTATTITFFKNRKNSKNVKCKINDNKILNLSELNDSQFNEVFNYIEFIRMK